MAVSLPPWVFQQYRDDDGVPLAGGTVSFFVAGETTPLAAYTDATETSGFNVLTLDSSGYGIFWLQQGLAYKLVLRNATGTWTRTVDSVLIAADVAIEGVSYPLAFELLDDVAPIASQIMGAHVFTEDVSFPANFAGSFGAMGTTGANPTTSFVAALEKNGVECGTMTISTAGAYSFASTGGAAVDFLAGDLLEVFAPATPDATAQHFVWTLVGAVSA